MRIAPPTLKDTGLILFSASFMALLVMFATQHTAPHPTYALTAATAGTVVGLGMVFYHWTVTPSLPPVDIWDYQRRMMAASRQQMPESPELNATSLLYLALTLEEVSEMASTMQSVLMRERSTRWSRWNMSHQLQAVHMDLKKLSKILRDTVPALTDMCIPLNPDEAVALFDDTTDITVVVAGLPIASGLPAAAGYVEVQSSNLSKANPSTGMIEKDASGKWIKGRHYTPPDLARVLRDAWAPDFKVKP